MTDDHAAILHVNTRATRAPDGSWKGAIELPSASGLIVIRAEVPRGLLEQLCRQVVVTGSVAGVDEVGQFLEIAQAALPILGNLLGGGGGGGAGGGGGGLGGMLGGLLGGGGGGGGGGLGGMLGGIPIIGPLLGGLLGGGGGGAPAGGAAPAGGGGPLGGIMSMLGGLLGGGGHPQAAAPAPAPQQLMQQAPAILGGANVLAGADQLVSRAPEMFGSLAGPITELMRTGLRTIDQQAGALMGDPTSRAALQTARQAAERKVANALRVAEGILAQGTS